MTSLMHAADELLGHAEDHGATLRLIGSLAVAVHGERSAELAARLDREPPGDLDFAGLAAETGALRALFAAGGWEPDPALAAGQEYGIGRLIFHRGEEKVDVFLDELRMCHVIPLKERLAADARTVPLAELLLSKLQVVELTRKDVVDTLVLLAEHPVGDGDEEQVNGARIADLLRRDWGFEHTVRCNLDAVLASAELARLDDGDATAVRERVQRLTAQLDAAPRTLAWRLRAKVGTRARWYEEVGDVER